MTASKATLRRRRRADDDISIPPDVEEWFAAGCPDGASLPWAVLLQPTSDHVPDWWRAWRESHPDATACRTTRFLVEPSR